MDNAKVAGGKGKGTTLPRNGTAWIKLRNICVGNGGGTPVLWFMGADAERTARGPTKTGITSVMYVLLNILPLRLNIQCSDSYYNTHKRNEMLHP